MNNIIEIKNVSKTFPGGVKANDNVSLSVKKGEIHALLGENGAGKSTLMSILFGLIKSDSGSIKVNGETLVLKNPRDAVKAGISMLPQHFKLMENISVWRNIALGYEITKTGVLSKKEIINKLDEIGSKNNIKLNWESKVENLSISDKQKVELLKMLWKDVEILIFDEPTAILTPNQIKEFLDMCSRFKKAGKTILLITHKLDEIKIIADRCTIMNKGKSIETVDVSSTSEDKLVKLMLGEAIDLNLSTIKKLPIKKEIGVVIKKLSYNSKNTSMKSFSDINFEIKKGEILGIAAIEGNGQGSLFKVLSGLSHPIEGEIKINNMDVTKFNSEKLYDRIDGKSLISHIPEDRHDNGLVLDLKCGYNLVLQDLKQYSRFGVLSEKRIEENLKAMINEYDIRGINNTKKTKIKELSGGNQQKLIVAREVERQPYFLLAKYPTRGLDVGAIRNVYENLIDARNKGSSILLSSGELQEILEVSDRIAIMVNGKIIKIIDAKNADKMMVGSLMTGGVRNA